MPKTLIDISEYDIRTVDSDMLYIKSLLDDMGSWTTPHLYRILEYFLPEDTTKKLHYSPTVYEIYNLTMEIEGGECYSDGYINLNGEHMSNDTSYMLNNFLLDSIIMIGVQKDIIILSFEDGFIKIKY